MGLFDAVGSFLGTNKSGEAIAAQQAAAGEAARIQKEMYEQSRADLQPWREAGGRALSKMEDADYMRDFTAADFQADPGYQFRMSEGMKALERSAAAKGGLMGGANLKALSRFGQDLASQEYGNAYNRFNADRDRRFGRLSNLSGMGQQSAAQTANNAMQYGQAAAENSIGLGNSIASAKLAQGNQNAEMLKMAAQGAAFAFSDERLKKDIKPIASEDMDELKATLKAYSYKFKNKEHGKGDYIGVLAQDLEKSKLGKTLVTEDENGNKVVDLGRVMHLFLATLAEA